MCAKDLLMSAASSILESGNFAHVKDASQLVSELKQVIALDYGCSETCTASGEQALREYCERYISLNRLKGASTCGQDCEKCDVSFALCASISPDSSMSSAI